jgi:hypothetical protein
MSSLRDSHASHSQSPEDKRQIETTETYGLKRSGSYARYDRDTCSWRMCQGCFTEVMDISDEFSETWPKAGTMLDGVLYLRPTWELPISENGSGYWRTPDSGAGGTSGLLAKGITERPDGQNIQIRLVDQVKNRYLWPTPRANDNESRQTKPTPSMVEGRHGWSLKAAIVDSGSPEPVRLWPTPKAQDWGGSSRSDFSPKLSEVVKKWGSPTASAYKDSGEAVRMGKVKANSHLGRQVLQDGGTKTRQKGQLNPEWEDWLMGVPIGWSGKKVLEMHRFQEWLDSHGSC